MSVGEAPGILAIPAADPRTSAAERSRAKRAIDVVVALAVAPIALPVVLLCALAILIDDGGPAFFVQERVGLAGSRFRLWKLRTMIRGAELMRADMAGQNGAAFPAFKIAADPRVTRVGRWLRRSSLDELPQLLNVLRGEMSLVGPRPPLPSEVQHYDAKALRRLDVRPGLTCLWQVEHRHVRELTFEEWLDLDLLYIREWSLWWDLVLMVRTIPAVVRMTGT